MPAPPNFMIDRPNHHLTRGRWLNGARATNRPSRPGGGLCVRGGRGHPGLILSISTAALHLAGCRETAMSLKVARAISQSVNYMRARPE